MKKKDCKFGTIVCAWNEQESDSKEGYFYISLGKVKLVEASSALVEWNAGCMLHKGKWKTNHITRIAIKELRTELEGKLKLEELTHNTKKLEKEFEAVKQKLFSKIENTADIIYDLSLDMKNYSDVISDKKMRELISPIKTALNTIGWKTSALLC